MDPLHDPDDEALLDPRQARDLAGLVETARLASAVVRYGLRTRVGAATVVLNQDNPLPAANHACALWGTLAEVAGTLLSLEQVFAEAGRSEAVVFASPTTVAEIEGIADDAGWRAVEELVALLHRTRQDVRGWARPAEDRDLPGIVDLIADDAGLSEEGERRLLRHLEHRLDEPRSILRVVDDQDADRIAGFAQGFVERRVGLVEQVVVRPGRRRRGIGGEVVAEVVEELRERGALMVAGYSEEGGTAERFAEACGFDVVYGVTAYARRIDDLL
ncbi:Acetyltransferase (GNAT) family protein [Saccharopolyspora antimicrobica]|uniref:Acetyltransferase (GNAT) family protein n=1 Tax=Saccharopolyspora antimicrobica TaxID=455193 RepID=A0A1I5AB13_9PSEU|nr:GNAT family N-acetyltransferase [Saccharopolyspora antimicrobica]RKT83207.1 acetyltransferase (GNAT) family protein [Saccharopolyspora antimicrobica]SFN59603.1 Acetyltransferase (GNAT) family protein [Saccharopolyspora antimicrobica]